MNNICRKYTRVILINNFRNGRSRGVFWLGGGRSQYPWWILASPTTTPKAIPALRWRGVPGMALLLTPHVSLWIGSSLAPRTARHGAATISGKYLRESL